MKLMNHQEKLVNDLEKDYYNKVSSIVGWYTGSGKTTIINELIKRLYAKNPKIKVGFSSHFFTSLRDQVAKVLGKNHLVSIIPEEDATVHVFTPRLMYNRKNKFDLLIIDEAHEGLSSDSKMLHAISKRAKVIIHLTATGWKLMREFPKLKVYLRGLDVGLNEDKRVGEFQVRLMEFEGEVTHKDLDESGEVSASYLKKNMDLIKQFQSNKLKQLVKEKKLGDKTLVIVPPNGFIENAYKSVSNALMLTQESDEESVMFQFKNDPDKKFLIVVRKCGVGFDMPELTDVVDLTMTRNFMQIVQRIGRVTRPHPHKVEKRYHYVYDKRMSAKSANYYMLKSLDLSRCDYSDTGKTKPVYGFSGGYPTEFKFSDALLIRSNLREANIISLADYKNTGMTQEEIIEHARKFLHDRQWRELSKVDTEEEKIRRRMKKLGLYKRIQSEIFLTKENLKKRFDIAKGQNPTSVVKQLRKTDEEAWAKITEFGYMSEFNPKDPIAQWSKERIIEMALSMSESDFRKYDTHWDRAKDLGVLNEIRILRCKSLSNEVIKEKAKNGSEVAKKVAKEREIKFDPKFDYKKLGLRLEEGCVHIPKGIMGALNNPTHCNVFIKGKKLVLDFNGKSYKIPIHIKNGDGCISTYRLVGRFTDLVKCRINYSIDEENKTIKLDLDSIK